MRSILESQKQLRLTYPEVGATSGALPSGYGTHHDQFPLGQGAAAFELARQAVREWKMFDIGWLRIQPPEQPIAAGGVVGVVVQHFGFWSLNVSRIVYVIDEPRRYGFAYGTLPEYAETGEERFQVELKEDGAVWYDILAFSRERHLLAKIGTPLSRALQAKFRRDSGTAMRRAVAAAG
ncbi:MAG TPA: DUF1990 domain-containing protein [Bryobacteraceae bacterium]|nr:DUF1990 domain-containing protein [Bryobacteraceae bacterium]